MVGQKLQRHPSTVLPLCGLVLVLLFATLGVSAAPAPAPAPAQPAPAPAQPAPSLQQLFRQAAPSVVLITQVDAAGKWTSLGSGFVVSPSGVVVTNNHVIAPDQGAVHISVKMPRGDVFTDVQVIYADARRDFAVLSIRASGLPTLKVGDSDKVEVGDQVVAIGNPEGMELTFTTGIVSAIRSYPARGLVFIQHQAPISHGSSGGPLLNMKGEVIGLNTWAFFAQDNAQNLNGAVPINYVKPYLGDETRMTWEEFARANPSQAPAPSTGRPAPPGPPAGRSAWPVRLIFEKVSMHRSSDTSHKLGFAAGVYDAVALFAAAAQGSGGIDKQEVLALYQCLDGKGDKLGQLRDWVNSVVAQASSDRTAVASLLASACQRSFSPDRFFWTVSQYRPKDSSLKLGYAAGIFDGVSLIAAAVDDSDVNPKTLALYGCFNDHSTINLGQLQAWMDSVLLASSDSDAAVSVIAGACQRTTTP